MKYLMASITLIIPALLAVSIFPKSMVDAWLIFMSMFMLSFLQHLYLFPLYEQRGTK